MKRDDKMNKANEITDILIENYPREEHIHHDNPFKVLITCIISQRNRDKVTSRVSKALFNKWGTPEEISKVSVEEMQDFLSEEGIGLYNNKGEWIVKAAEKIANEYNGKVPEDADQLMKIKGIGRKCMNIVMAYGFKNPAIPVDTHVKRVSQRIGLAPEDSTAEEVEEILKDKTSKEKWFYLNHAMVDHGKNLCKPQNPKCNECSIKNYCNYYEESSN